VLLSLVFSKHLLTLICCLNKCAIWDIQIIAIHYLWIFRIVFYNIAKYITVEADKGRLTQAVSNILNNAIKFKQEGTITISIGLERKKEEHNNQEIVVSIQNTGQGIDSEILPKLFTKFAY
jgi:signal transduction histidine kinase